MDADEFLDTVRLAVPGPQETVRIGVVDTALADRATVVFDGEDVATTKEYLCVNYSPTAGDRVCLLRAGHSWIIIGEIGSGGGGLHHHDADYADIAHDHDPDYADIAHSHPHVHDSLIVVGSVNTGFNLNNAGGQQLGWGGIESDHADWNWQASEAAQIAAQFDGSAWISTNIEMTTVDIRTNIRIRIQKNSGASYLLGAGAMGYIRAASGHNESSIYLRAFDPSVQDGDKYRVWCEEYAGAGTVNPISDGCYFAAERVS